MLTQETNEFVGLIRLDIDEEKRWGVAWSVFPDLREERPFN